jgi:peptide/nickel transport system substrate-binding protein
VPRSPFRPLYALLLLAGCAVVAGAWLRAGAAGGGASTRYVEAVVGHPGPINPLLANDDATRDVTALVFDGLMRIAGDGTPEPDLAARWDVTPDGLTYTFTLRTDATWHDGAPVTAQDVAFTIAQLQAPGFAGPPALAAPWAGVQVFVDDARTVLFHLPQPSADFLTRCAVGLLPAHLLQGVAPGALPDAAFNHAPVGTGPYRLLTLDGAQALLEANTSYVLGAPAIHNVELRFYADAASQRRALENGEATAGLLDDRPGDDVRALLASHPRLAGTPLLRDAYVVLYLNNEVAPLDDVRVRRALLASLDRAALFAASGALGRVGDGVIVPGSWAFTATPPAATTQPDALWAAAGYQRDASGALVKDGRPLALELVTNADAEREAVAQAVSDELAAAGVQVTVVPTPTPQLVAQKLVPRSYQLALFGWEAAADPDPYPGWHSSQIAAPGNNIAAFHDSAADALLEQARTTLDGAERRDLYQRFASLFQQEAASLVLYYPARLYVHPKALTGLSDGLLFAPASRFRDVQNWRLP